jgi:dihydroorotase
LKKQIIANGSIFLDGKFQTGSILIHDDRIYDVITGETKILKSSEYETTDASGCFVSYGFMDPHVHFRCPGQEYKEDWQSGSRSAIKGGYTFVIDMPNNVPSATDMDVIRLKNSIACKTKINYGFYIGLTDGNSDDIGLMFSALNRENIPVYGIKVFLGSSTGDLLVRKSETIRKSLETGIMNLFHCEDEDTLLRYGSIEYKSIKDHDARRPSEAEVNGIIKILEAAKDIRSVANIYICHVSSKAELDFIDQARTDGFMITSEITPHHLYFDLENIGDSNIFKVNPPIRLSSDSDYLRHSFDKGFFDIIGTDHAPHLLSEKNSVSPPSGFPGLETSFYALYKMYEEQKISVEMIFKLLTAGYSIFKIEGRGEIKKGNFADLTIIKNIPFEFIASEAETKSGFSPFDGIKSSCRIDTVMINGEIVMKEGVLL